MISDPNHSTSRIGSMVRLAKTVGVDALLWLVGIGLVATTVFLMQENRALRATAYGETAPKLVAGAHLPRNLSAPTLEGALRPIDFHSAQGMHTLMITFSPVCPHCRANHRNWKTVAQELRRRKDWRVLWISRDSVQMTKEYCEDADIPSQETLAEPTYQTFTLLDLRVVPNTVVADSEGRVERVWPGELDATGWKDLFTFLHMPPEAIPSL